MEEKKIVTIDLGTEKLGLCIACEDQDGRIRILHYNEVASDGISHGKVLNPSKLGNALKKAIEGGERYLSLKIKEVFVNVQKYDIREISVDSELELSEGRCISAEDIENLDDLAWSEARGQLEEGEDVFGVVAQSFNADQEWGVGSNDIVGMMARSISGHYKAYIGKTNYHDYIDAAFNAAGIGTTHGAFVPAQTGKSVLTASEIESGVALLDIGAGGSSVSIFYNGTLRHYSAIPFGGNNITADIRNLCGVETRLADNIKMGYGGLMPDKLASLGDKTLKITDVTNGDKVEITAKYLSEIITARMREIIEAMLYEIQKSDYADKLKNGIVVCGGCANTLNMCNLIKEMSGYNARVGAPSRKLFVADSNFFTASAAASAGLVLQFIGKAGSGCTAPKIAEPEPVQELSLEEILSETEDDREKRREEIKRRKAEEKEAQRLRKEMEKKRKEEERKARAEAAEKNGENRKGLADMFGSLLFGDDNEPENLI